MTQGELIDLVREDLDDYVASLQEQGITPEDDVDDEEDFVSEVCSFLMQRMRERNE